VIHRCLNAAEDRIRVKALLAGRLEVHIVQEAVPHSPDAEQEHHIGREAGPRILDQAAEEPHILDRVAEVAHSLDRVEEEPHTVHEAEEPHKVRVVPHTGLAAAPHILDAAEELRIPGRAEVLRILVRVEVPHSPAAVGIVDAGLVAGRLEEDSKTCEVSEEVCACEGVEEEWFGNGREEKEQVCSCRIQA